MKNLKYRVTVALAITTFLLFGFNVKSAVSETYLGEHCWRIDVTSPFVESWTYKLGVFQKDGGHFTLNGTEDNTAAVHGNAEILGNNVVINLVSNGTDIEGAWLDNINASLNVNTLSGSFNGFSQWHDAGDPFGASTPNVSMEGTMTKIPCP